MAGALTIQVFVPGVLKNPLNHRAAHWSETYKIGEAWKTRTIAAWLDVGRPTWDGPAAVTLTAYVAKLWDHDEGINAACKPIRDMAVKYICGTDDGPGSGHSFSYRQEVRPDYRGVLITVEEKSGHE